MDALSGELISHFHFCLLYQFESTLAGNNFLLQKKILSLKSGPLISGGCSYMKNSAVIDLQSSCLLRKQ